MLLTGEPLALSGNGEGFLVLASLGDVNAPTLANVKLPVF